MNHKEEVRERAELMLAWANGAEVQYSYDGSSWFDSLSPSFLSGGILWRIKPSLTKQSPKIGEK